MKLTPEEIKLTELVADKCKQYGFFVSPCKRIFFERENPKEVPKNQIICMLKRDLQGQTSLSKKRFNALVDVSLQALLIMCEMQIKEKITSQ